MIQTSDRFYKNCKSFAFRQILKVIYDSGKGYSFDEILKKVSTLTHDSLSKKLNELLEEKCISQKDRHPRFIAIQDKNYGRTFEWFVSEIIKREMHGISCSGVKIRKLRSGGDFDVLCRLEDLLVHFECKSGSVNNITEDDITKFIQRYKELAP